MNRTNVRNYTADELLLRVKGLGSFTHTPKGYWILGVRSNEDAVNVYDDKFYIFKGDVFIMVMTGTTNSGEWGLLNFEKYGAEGLAQIKGDEWYYNVWTRGLHKKRMEALVQTGPFKVLRDSNKNFKAGDVTEWAWESWKGLNFHCNSYDTLSTAIKWLIGKWSVGCQVSNNVPKYYKFLRMSKPQKTFTYCLIEEF